MGERIAQRWAGRCLKTTTVLVLLSMSAGVVFAQDETATVADHQPTPTETLPEDAPDDEVPQAVGTEDGPDATSEADDVDSISQSTVSVEHEPNFDSLVEDSSIDHWELLPGQQLEIHYTYHVTTPRESTIIAAELRLADGSPALSWEVWASTGQGNWTGQGPVAEVSETGSIAPETSFPLALSITAPADASEEHSVYLHISSAVVLETGEPEVGLEGWEPLAGLTIIPPLPTQSLPGTDAPSADNEATEVVDYTPGEIDVATPTMPVPDPALRAETANEVIGALHEIAAGEDTPAVASIALTCDSWGATEIGAAGYAELGCQYTADDDADKPHLIASLTDPVGEGWEIAIGESFERDIHWGARGERVVWEASDPLENGATVKLLIRLFAPESADPTHGATVKVALDGQVEFFFTWVVGIGTNAPIAMTSAGCSPTIGITSIPPSWGVPVSDTTRQLHGELSYQIQTGDTCGWSVSMAATWFSYSGSHNSAGFSPGSISFESTGLSAPRGVRESRVRETLYRPVQLLVADSTTPAGTVEQTLALTVNLPKGAAPGRYTSTITITVTSNGDPGG